jgi:hypothetical protein
MDYRLTVVNVGSGVLSTECDAFATESDVRRADNEVAALRTHYDAPYRTRYHPRPSSCAPGSYSSETAGWTPNLEHRTRAKYLAYVAE